LNDSPHRRLGFDPLIPLLVIALVGIGLMLIYSADHAQESFIHIKRQAVLAASGMLLLTLAAVIPPRIYYGLSYVLYGAAVVGLLLVLVAGTGASGARRWLTLGSLNLQPAEPAKIAFILVTARVLSARHSVDLPWRVVRNVVLLGIPPLILVVLQPDLGTATVFPVVGAVMLAWSGLPLRVFVTIFLPFISLFFLLCPWLLAPVVLAGVLWLNRVGAGRLLVISVVLVCAGAAISGPVAWNQLKPYQKKRLTTFLDPSADPLGAGYQIIQSQVAIGSGGVTGRGYLQGTQTQLRFLPQQHTDFIFSLAGEEFGFVGTSTIIFLYLMLGWRGFRAAAGSKNPFSGICAAGLTAFILYHATVNIGMTLGILPVTGLPAPFLSYGGSFLLTCLCASGMIIAVTVRRRG